MYSKKSIVLNGIDNEQKGILTLQQDDGGVIGNIRLYNFSKEPSGIMSLGIYENENVIKAGLTRISDMFFGFKSELKSVPENFSCALVNFVGGEPKPLLYGTSEGYFEKTKIFDEVVSKLKNTLSAGEAESILDEYGVDFDSSTKKDINDEINKNLTIEDLTMCNNICSDKCESCEYKKFYISRKKPEKSYIKITENKEVERVKKTFYEEMKDHIDRLFSENPEEDYLEKLLPNSKFVRVNLEENNYYVLGLIFENVEIKYICYGLPGIYQKNPPRQLAGSPIWFPIDQDKPEAFGYWLSYQDARSGESVKALIV